MNFASNIICAFQKLFWLIMFFWRFLIFSIKKNSRPIFLTLKICHRFNGIGPEQKEQQYVRLPLRNIYVIRQNGVNAFGHRFHKLLALFSGVKFSQISGNLWRSHQLSLQDANASLSSFRHKVSMVWSAGCPIEQWNWTPNANEQKVKLFILTI